MHRHVRTLELVSALLGGQRECAHERALSAVRPSLGQKKKESAGRRGGLGQKEKQWAGSRAEGEAVGRVAGVLGSPWCGRPALPPAATPAPAPAEPDAALRYPPRQSPPPPPHARRPCARPLAHGAAPAHEFEACRRAGPWCLRTRWTPQLQLPAVRRPTPGAAAAAAGLGGRCCCCCCCWCQHDQHDQRGDPAPTLSGSLPGQANALRQQEKRTEK